jgi:hypothetical protein
MEWSKATIARYNPDDFLHLIRFNEREQGSVKHEERWVNLAKTRFQWLTQPSPTAPPNPTHQGAPKGEEAVGYQVRVFWPGMAKWYQGKVEAYDNDTKQHTVKYRDGDIKTYKLRHEAVVYLDKSTTPARKDRPRGSSKDKDEEGGSLKKKGSNKKDKDGRSLTAGVKRKNKEDSSVDDDQNDGEHRSKNTSKSAGRNKSSSSQKKRKGPSSEADGEEEEEEDDEDEGDSEEDSEEADSDDKNDEEDIESEEASEIEEDFPKVHKKKKHGASGASSSAKAASRGVPSKQQQQQQQRKSKAAYPSSTKQRKKAAAGVNAATGAGAVVPPQQLIEGAPRRRGRPPGSGTGRRNNVRGRLGSGPGRKDFSVPRMMRAEEEIIRSAGAAVVNARVAVFYNDEDSLYKGKLIQFDSYHKRHKVVYDDGEEEWIALPRESFRYLTPRTRSAGCNATFRKAMSQLGAAQEVGAPLRHSPDATIIQGTTTPVGEVAPAPPSTEESAGWEVSVRSAADGRWHRAEILTYDSHRSMHFVLYIDGEDEWLRVTEEEVVWHRKLPAGRQGLFPGKSPDVSEPAGRDAVGWRVAVFWPGDAAFYPGEIAGWDEATGQYEVSYDDGEEGVMKLKEDPVKWILPPGVAVDHENLERMEVGGGRPRRRVTAAGGDSDPDYEFENTHGGYHLGSGGGGGGGGRGGRRGGGGFGRGSGRVGRPSAATLAAMHSWGDSLGGDGSDALPSPMAGAGGYQHHYTIQQHRGGNGHHHSHRGGPMPMPFGHFSQHATMGGAATAPQTFVGDPVVHRTMARIAAFGCPSNGAEVSLPNAVTVKIYLSSSGVDEEKGTAAAVATTPSAAVEAVPVEDGSKPAAGGASSEKAEATKEGGNTQELQQQQPPPPPLLSSSNDGGVTAPPSSAADIHPGRAIGGEAATPPAIATIAAPVTATTATTIVEEQSTPQGPVPPAAKLQARLQALDLMARRVGRAQQSIIKGVPTDLPTHVIRPLRLGPPPSVARLVAAGAPGVVAPARTPGSGTQNGGTPHGSGGAHRLARPSGVSHSPFHRRRSLEEEDDSEEDVEDDDEGGDHSSDDDGADGSRDDHDGNVVSSNGSSDDEDGRPRSDNGDENGDEEEDEVVVSPRSPTLPRGGKVKPSGGSGDFGSALGTATGATGAVVVDTSRSAHGNGGSPMVSGLVPALPPSPFMPQAPPLSSNGNGGATSAAANDGAAAVAGTVRATAAAAAAAAAAAISMQQHPGLDLKELSVIQGGGAGGGLPASDSVANLLNIPRNQSAMLLGDMPSASGCPSENGDFMDLA